MKNSICLFLKFYFTTGIETDPRLNSNSILHMSSSIKMEDKSSHQLDHMDSDFANEAGRSDSKILVNVLDYDIKGGTQQTSPIILSPLENTITLINNYNSNLHMIQVLFLNTLAGSLVIELNDINSNVTVNKIPNDNWKPTKTLLGINKRRILSNILGFNPKEGMRPVSIITSQRHAILTNNENDDDLLQEIPIQSNLNNIIMSLKQDTWIADKHHISFTNFIKYTTLNTVINNFCTNLKPSYDVKGGTRQVGSVPMEQVVTAQSVIAKGPPADPPDRVYLTNE